MAGDQELAEVREQTLPRQGTDRAEQNSLGEKGIAVAGDQELAEVGNGSLWQESRTY